MLRRSTSPPSAPTTWYASYRVVSWRADEAAAPTPCAALASMRRARDRGKDGWRSKAQLLLGIHMVWDARRKRLCRRQLEGMAS